MSEEVVVVNPKDEQPLVYKKTYSNGLIETNYTKLFENLEFKCIHETHTNPLFNGCLSAAFESLGLTNQKQFTRTINATKHNVVACNLSCKAKDNIGDVCNFKVNIRKDKNTGKWHVFYNNLTNFICNCGSTPESIKSSLPDKEMDEKQKSIIDNLSLNNNKGVDYFKTLKQFKLNQPGTKTFSELREIITKELKSQLGIKKNFKIQIRRTGGSKESDYAFLDCFLNDKKDSLCKFKASFKRDKSTNDWYLDDFSSRNKFVCTCKHISDSNDDFGYIINSKIAKGDEEEEQKLEERRKQIEEYNTNILDKKKTVKVKPPSKTPRTGRKKKSDSKPAIQIKDSTKLEDEEKLKEVKKEPETVENILNEIGRAHV
ncbi:uncharacterized protein HGUI_00479 [Hanseniaspora guilliermondii]|uniref:Uncharacterized protein n=1 Tax=Hanseniaspora guilliermondii TaxID=56406 RepID=A0A1L0CU52_9ASCO|nr:uncharacterized protein HGUI_00479 [Hanseniaspora guilliermondii]